MKISKSKLAGLFRRSIIFGACASFLTACAERRDQSEYNSWTPSPSYSYRPYDSGSYGSDYFNGFGTGSSGYGTKSSGYGTEFPYFGTEFPYFGTGSAGYGSGSAGYGSGSSEEYHSPETQTNAAVIKGELIKLLKKLGYDAPLNASSTFEDIKKGYRKMILKYHPDKNDSVDFAEKSKQLNHLWDEYEKSLGK